jgi:Tol biopolymer transport system component
MSPEQLRGEIPDARSDLFSLGLVLYEMATGRRAFGRATNAVTSAAILHEQPVAPRQLRPEVPARLEQTILTLLEKDRDIRTQTASELRADLTRLKRELLGARAPDAPPLGGAVGDNGPAPTAASASPSSSSDAQVIAGVIRRHRSAAVLAAALLLLTVVAIGYFTRSHTSATPSADGVSGLSVADLQVEQLTTSGTADAPAISPDGNYVVYIERGAGLDSLRVRQVATESSVPIVPSEPGTVLRGATVTPDGAFVNFVRQVGAQPFELWQVPLLGGTARRLFPGGRVGFSPKGDQMAHVRTASAGRTELVVTSSDGSGERILASRQLPKRFWPAGATNSFAPAWAADGATIAVLGADGDAGQVVLVDVKTGSEQAVASGSALAGTGLEWLTNDTLLVSMVDRPSAMLQLWLVSRGGGAHRRLTNDTNEYFGVSVTADRNAVVTARGEYSFDIWTTDAAVIKWSQAIPTKRSKGPPFSPLHWIGDDLLFISSSTNSLTLSRWHTSTRYEEVLAKSAGRPSVSRDGSTILFLDYDSNELWSMNQVTQTRDRIRGRVGLRDTARLTPDGHHYVTIDTPAGSAPAIVLAALDGTNSPRTITTDRVRVGASLLDLGRVEVSRDGQWVAYSSVSEGGQPLIAVCDLAACSSRREFAGLGGRWQWAPDSLALAYVDPKTQSDLWVQPLDASAPRRLAQFEPDGHEIWSFEWSADARRLAVSRGKASRDIVLVRGLGGKK